MKKQLITVLMLLTATVTFAQYRISTENGTFTIQDLGNSNDFGVPYEKAKVFGYKSSDTRVTVKIEGVSYNPKILIKNQGVEYTEFRDGNNSDATFASAEAVDLWFKENTGFKTSAGGSADVSYPNQGNVSFTMSVGNNEAPAEPYDYITESHLVADSKEEDAALTGGAWKYNVGNSEIRFIANQNSLASGNIGDSQNSIYWEAAFKVSGVFAIRFNGGDSQNEYYTLEIDGEDYPITNPDNVNAGRRWLTVDAGDGVHFVKLKGSLNVQWRGYRTEIGAIAEPWEYDKYSLFFGDSFTSGVGADYSINGYYNFVNDSETHRLIASGVGGSGYVNIGGSKALKDRIVEDYNLFLTDNGIPDEVIIAMGINDMGLSGIEEGANAAFDNLRTVYSGRVYVVGAWDKEAPNSLDGNYTSTKTQIINAMKNRDNFNFIDMQGVSYTKSDATHPDTAGHKTLGLHLKKYIGL